jgi:carboxymethylenebutenolidase
MLIQLAELDRRINSGWPEYEADLKSGGVDYTRHMYPQANHGFHNDSTGRFDEEQANLAWKRTVEFFRKHLS